MTKPQSESASASRPTVLVVDDESGLRDVLLLGLPKRNFDVTCASDGEAALELARKTKFDLAVCDIMMPGIDGIEVLKKLKEIHPPTEVIMVTGFATLETAVDSMKKGAYDYITKPFSINNLCLLLEKALERKRLKARVDDLEELSRLKSELLAVVSHELRTPMACIMGFVSLLLGDVYGAITARQRDPLERTLSSAENLLLLINNILDLSKLTANRMTLSEDVFELQDFGQEVIGAMEPLAAQKSLALALETSEGLWVRTDRTKLKQILINLVGNSIKFTEKGGITVRFLAAPETSHIIVEVTDTGIGIKEENMPLLFQEFRQVDSSTTRKHGGAGLGLSLVKKMVDLIGGSIRAESVYGTGSTFFLKLPIRTTAPSLQPSAPATGSTLVATNGTSKNVVLCIDDDPTVLKLLSDSLEATDFEFVGALSGVEGLALARQLHPQIITLDIMMPHMDGWSLLHALKQDPELNSIPVFIVSIVDNKPLAFSLGARGYLLKPFTRDQLLAALRTVNRELSPQALVVDDDPSVRDLISKALQDDGYTVQTAASGEDAIRCLTQCRPTLLLLDLVMPVVSGFDVLHAMDAMHFQETFIIVMAEEKISKEEEAYLKRRVQAILRKKAHNIGDVIKNLRTNLPTTNRTAA